MSNRWGNVKGPVVSGIQRVHQLGFSDALQIEAEEQDDNEAISRLMEAARPYPPTYGFRHNSLR